MNDEFSYTPGPFYVVRRVFRASNNAAQVLVSQMHVNSALNRTIKMDTTPIYGFSVKRVIIYS